MVSAAEGEAPPASRAPDPPEGGFIDTHVHAFACRKDGLDVVDA